MIVHFFSHLICHSNTTTCCQIHRILILLGAEHFTLNFLNVFWFEWVKHCRWLIQWIWNQWCSHFIPTLPKDKYFHSYNSCFTHSVRTIFFSLEKINQIIIHFTQFNWYWLYVSFLPRFVIPALLASSPAFKVTHYFITPRGFCSCIQHIERKREREWKCCDLHLWYLFSVWIIFLEKQTSFQ